MRNKLKRLEDYRLFLQTQSNYEKLKGTSPNGLLYYPLQTILQWIREIEIKILSNEDYTFSDKLMLDYFERIYTNKQ